MRGKGTQFDLINPFLRITPAYAGKSTDDEIVEIASEDHPRLCGEKTQQILEM